MPGDRSFERPPKVPPMKQREKSVPRLQLNQAAARGIGDGFGAANDVHLGEDRFYVRFHRTLADEERSTDFLVAFSLGHQLEHVDLARAQCFTANSLCQLGCEMNWDTSFTG